MKNKIILDLCGGTGSWSKPYKEAGYTVYNITFPDYDVTKTDIKDGRYLDFLCQSFNRINLRVSVANIYGILAAPPCTEFSIAKGAMPRNFNAGMQVVRACLDIIWEVRKRNKLIFWAMENPTGFLRQFIGNPPYSFQPWHFGDFYTKKTDLWGYFNKPRKSYKDRPLLVPYTRHDEHQQHLSTPKCPPEYRHLKLDRAAIRAITPRGFALAFFKANQ